MEEQENEKQERKLRDCFAWKIRYVNTRFPHVFKARLQLSVSENVFCQGMIVLLNPVCILLSGILHGMECCFYRSGVRVAVFET